jgi:DNA-binding IclR family transcriptional regulator
MINSVLKAVRILKLFSTAEPQLSLAEISRRLDIPKSTAHHLLNTLLVEGLIEKVDRESYALAPGIITLTQNVRVNVDLRDRAAPYLRSLADLHRESVYLTIRDGDQVLYIYAVESPHRLMARTAVGEHAYMHCTGVGKSILAHLPEAEVDGILSRTGMPRYTAHTLTDPAALKQQLTQTRERGYSFDFQEHEMGNFCVGAPIFDARAAVIGACSVAGIDPEIVGSRATAISADIVNTTLQISRNMGYVPTTTPRIRMPL